MKKNFLFLGISSLFEFSKYHWTVFKMQLEYNILLVLYLPLDNNFFQTCPGTNTYFSYTARQKEWDSKISGRF